MNLKIYCVCLTWKICTNNECLNLIHSFMCNVRLIQGQIECRKGSMRKSHPLSEPASLILTKWPSWTTSPRGRCSFPGFCRRCEWWCRRCCTWTRSSGSRSATGHDFETAEWVPKNRRGWSKTKAFCFSFAFSVFVSCSIFQFSLSSLTFQGHQVLIVIDLLLRLKNSQQLILVSVNGTGLIFEQATAKNIQIS